MFTKLGREQYGGAENDVRQVGIWVLEWLSGLFVWMERSKKDKVERSWGAPKCCLASRELSWERFSGCVPPLCSSFPCHFRAKSWPERQVTWPFKPMSGNLQKTPRTAAMLVPSRFLNSATLYGAGRQVGFEDFMGSNYPLVNIQKAIENGPLTVDLPINSMVIFHSYVNLPEGIFSISYSI
jgi:hypothetical protein